MNDAVAGGKVTALKVQKHHPNRVNVYLDNEYSFRFIAHHRCLASSRTGIKLIQDREITSRRCP